MTFIEEDCSEHHLTFFLLSRGLSFCACAAGGLHVLRWHGEKAFLLWVQQRSLGVLPTADVVFLPEGAWQHGVLGKLFPIGTLCIGHCSRYPGLNRPWQPLPGRQLCSTSRSPFACSAIHYKRIKPQASLQAFCCWKGSETCLLAGTIML